MSDHIIKRYDINVVCAGLFKLMEDRTLLERYHRFLDHEYLYYKDESPEVKSLRRIVEIMVEMVNDSGAESVTMEGLGSSLIIKEGSVDRGKELKAQFDEWRTRDEILKKVNDPTCFLHFLDYLKVIKLARVSRPFSMYYQEGKIKLASDTMKKALEELNNLSPTKTDSFSGDGLMDYLSQQEQNYNDRAIMLGNDVIDDQIGGFEPQTLNLFISVTNGGKTMMSHHLIRRCIESGQKVYVACVEDRKRSFIFKIVSALTGIRQSRLKKDFRNLTLSEMEEIKKAEALMKRFLKVDFIYGNKIEEIHKCALDYDLECENRSLPKAVVNIVDYTGHIASMASGDKTFEKMRNAYAARKDFALKYNKICFDFAQVNREGSKKLQEDRILSQSDLAGAYDLSQVCDNIISINRNSTDITEGGCKLHIAKARDGAVGTTVWVKTDFASARYVMEDCRVVHAPQEVRDAWNKKNAETKGVANVGH